MITTESTLFEAVFMRYYSLVYQLAYRYVGQRDEAEDIVQEVFLRFHRTPPQERHEEAQRAWLCRVTSHLSLNALRTKNVVSIVKSTYLRANTTIEWRRQKLTIPSTSWLPVSKDDLSARSWLNYQSANKHFSYYAALG